MLLPAPPLPRAALAGALLAALSATALAGDGDDALLTVTIIGTTPLDTGARDRVPGGTQRADAAALRESGTTRLPEFMERELGSVSLNSAQGNAYQPDLQYRGYTASPLLGLPQGVAVYRDGVRQNEPFGDTVNWDLIPAIALDRLELLPGSNPLFGLNALGGALALRSKDGFRNPGGSAELSTGSHGQRGAQAEHGGSDGPWAWYFAGNAENDDGWREHSPSRVRQGFGRLSWQDEATRVDFSFGAADNRLTGNGAAPEQLLRADRDAVFTYPDRTDNRASQYTLGLEQRLGETLSVAGNLHFRRTHTRTLNGDASDYEACDDGSGALCNEDGATVLGLDGAPVPAGDDTDSAVRHHSRLDQTASGFDVQATLTEPLFGLRNRLTVGAALEIGRAQYAADTELAALTADRGTIGSGLYDAEARVRVNGNTRSRSLYLADTLSLGEGVDLSFGARWNGTRVRLDDRSGDDALDGEHTYSRVDPAIGLSWRLAPQTTLYASYSEASRAPTPVELSCADPDAPCRLPNAFVQDPPLDQVVAHTVEIGARGRLDGGWRWQVSSFRSRNTDDILFIASGSTATQGYFDNVGTTLRSGIELGLSFEQGPWSGALHYTWLRARFGEDFTVASPNHPQRDPDDPDQPAAETAQVQRGNRIPGLPEHQLRLSAAYRIDEHWTLSGEVIADSDRIFRGDESNTDRPLPGYGLLNLGARWRASDNLNVRLRVDNVFDRRYANFGVYGDAGEVLGDDYTDARRFVSPGAPRTLSLSAELTF